MKNHIKYIVFLISFLCLSINSYAWDLAAGTYYFDNSQTQWTNVYLFIGHDSYVRSYQLTAGNNDIYSVSMSSWNGATAVYFANGDGGVSGGSSTVNINTAPNGLPTQNITARTSNYTSQPTAGYYCIPWANSGISIGSEWRQNLECPSDVLSASSVMFYINQSYGGSLGVTNNSSATCISTTNPKAALDNWNAYLTMANSNVPSTLSVTNNCGGWVGTGAFADQTAANAAGAYYKTGSSNQKVSATSLSVQASSTTITYGTSSITLTATTGGTSSSYGRNIYVQYYIDNGTTASATSKITSTSTQTSLSTSSLSVGTHTIKPVLTDRLVSVLGSSITLTVENVTPTTPSSGLSFSNVTTNQMTLNWTSGNGANRIVVAKAGSAPTGTPSDGSSYTANATYGTSGTALGDGYVVYNGSSNTVTVTGLSPSTTYYFKIYEYNGTGTATKYLTSSYLSGNQTTSEEKEYHTITIDGNTGDWYSNEKISTEHGSLYTAWDATYLYIGFSSGTLGDQDRINIGIDTDPGTNNVSGSSSVGTFAGQTFAGYLTPEYVVQSTAINNLKVFARSGTGWGSGTDIYSGGANLWRSGGTAEIRIPRSNIGLTTTSNSFALFVWFANSSDVSYNAFGAENTDNGGRMRQAFVFPNSGDNVKVTDIVKSDYNNSDDHTFSSTTINNIYISNATLTLNNDVTVSGKVVLGGGTLSDNGKKLTVTGTLQLDDNTTFSLGSGDHTHTFANSSSTTWASGKTLTISGWSGTEGSSGTAGKIKVGTDNTGLSSTQLAMITFSGHSNGTTILSTGEIVPAGANYYFRSKNSSGTWGTASDWEYSTDNQNWSASSIVPGANALGITIQSGQTMKIASAVNISAGKLTVNGTLQLENGGYIDNAPIYASGSTLIFNPESGNTIGVGKFWTENAQSGAGYPYNVTVASGKLSLDEIDSHDEHLFMANNLNVASGAELYLDMQDSDEPWNQIGLMVGGDITNAGTITMSTDCHQALSCDDFTNTGQTTLSSLSNGGDLYITGNFYNNGSSASAVNINGRALILTGNKDQTIGGSATGTYEIDYLIIGKSGGTVTVEHDLLCDGEGNGKSGGGAITVEGAILDISGRKVQIARNTADFYSTITTNETGSIRTNASTKLYILGDESTKNVGTIRFDQTTPDTTNVIGVLRLNRSNEQAEVDVANNFIVADSLKIEQGKLKSSADIQLKAGAVGFLSSTHSTAALELNRMIFGKTSTTAAEFYKNGRSLTINGGVRTKITFDQTSKWHFMSFPYQVTDVKKSDGTTAAVLGTDYSLGWYDATTRATNKSGWKTSTDHPMTAGKGYIINKKSPLEDLYFDNSSVTGAHNMFSSNANIPITYTTGSPYAPCNFGWNFVAHPLSAKATPSLAAGEFAYSYNPANDVYKLYYYQNNPGYTYGDASGMKPFEAYFIKAASASNLNVSYSLSSPQGVRRKTDAQPEDVVQLNLAANGTNYETLVRMKPEATAGYDELYDAPYSEPMNASTPRIYTLSSGTNYALALNTVPEETTVPVYVKVPQAGDYSLNWTAQLTQLPVTLTDQQTGETVDLTTETEYGFQTSTTEIKNRFYLNVPKRVITDNVNIENADHFLRIYPLRGNIEVEGLKGPSQIYLADMAGHILQAKVTGDSHCRLKVPVAGTYILIIRDAQHPGTRTKMMVW